MKTHNQSVERDCEKARSPSLLRSFKKRGIMIIDLGCILRELESVSDKDMLESMSSIDLGINQEKYDIAFSLYGMTKYFSALDISELAKEFPAAQMARYRSVIVFRAYVTLVYMRSSVLEKSLDDVDDGSPIFAFKKYFRAGKIGQGQDTLAQRMRNSICHGDFQLDLGKIVFHDSGWSAEIELSQFFDRFCPQIFRFYSMAFEANEAFQRTSR